jgi:Flp pilus assembly protein protease CpaA
MGIASLYVYFIIIIIIIIHTISNSSSSSSSAIVIIIMIVAGINKVETNCIPCRLSPTLILSPAVVVLLGEKVAKVRKAWETAAAIRNAKRRLFTARGRRWKGPA